MDADSEREIEILSVDDDPVNQMVVENLLVPLGYKVATCMNGVEALQYLDTEPRLPDLILLDVMMPQVCVRERESERASERERERENPWT